MTDELKPCPFCRMPMQHRFALHVSDGNTDDIIHAEPTDCGLQFFSVNSADQGKTVAAAWNTRVQPTPPDSECDMLLTVDMIETVPIEHPFSDRETDPIWRIEVGGYCADFEHSEAANNFALAVNDRWQAELTSLRQRAERLEVALRDALAALETAKLWSDDDGTWVGYGIVTKALVSSKAALEQSSLGAEHMSVTQADRDRAADMQHWRANDKPTEAERYMRDGLLDDNYTVQAFAAHRLAALVEVKRRFEYASGQFYNVEHWHDEDAPDGSGNLYDWFIRALTEGGDNE